MQKSVESGIEAAIVGLETKVDAMSTRLDKVEKHQLQLMELASFGKGSLKTLIMLGIALGGIAGIAIAIKAWIT
tara:strand:- start:805 stop:1026 length:222 start_codon:yes stop_codon:yes gene_type:complete